MIALTGKTALVTGAARGIGRSIAETLVACGARVAIADLDLAAAEKTAEEIGEARGFACDVSDPAAVTMLVQAVEDAFGSLDILVNNAGITKDNLMARMKDEDWDAVMNVNLRSAFVATRAAQRGMMKRRWGRIINISSVVGIMGNKGQANYSASKAGLIGLTKSSAKELASRNILVNAIAPGFIQTAMTDKLPEEARAALTAAIPMGRLGEPRDIANAVAFLASDLASYITGQVLVVDGGMVM
ncbi:MAG: 3-oxoacyl-[acyl-carrier-protein] reductase [Gemmatimonadetes bacterium]|nr:3-oxoacyl-[acyl-carrier-protein] reductase [Gemmatimonadota bacterium]